MAISGISGAVSPIHRANTQQVKAQQDSDGDNDGGKAERVEQSTAQQSNVSSISRIGANINIKA
jgi:hypothetical protein